MRQLLLILTVFISSVAAAQDGLAPLYSNDALAKKHVTKHSMQRGARATTYFYNYVIDTVHLPFFDDFSTNRFKQYQYDTANTVVDTITRIGFTVNGQYVDTLYAMYDTSYTYQTDGQGNIIDSTPNPALTVIRYERNNANTPIDTAIRWVRPDTLVLADSIIINPIADTSYLNYIDSVFFIPDDGYSLWTNNSPLHNYTYSQKPITLGMATFDGLDSLGQPYDQTMNPNTHQIADILASKPIYLNTRPNGGGIYDPINDSDIYFSFYYQPQGLGDMPEGNDSLVLEFYRPNTDRWVHMWSMPGSAAHDFKAVIVKVNPLFYQDGFKFRFKNYASVSGNFDHWNVDYIRLAENRNPADTTRDDVAMMDKGYSLLKDYEQMPWSHYKADSVNLMKTEQEVRMRNLNTQSTFVTTSFDAYEDGQPIFTGSVQNIPIFNANSIKTTPLTVQGHYPASDTAKTKSYHVKYWLQPGSDTVQINDTAFYHQQFGTQYAYDDGSAENAYFVVGDDAQIAVEYKLAKGDSLRAINIYFPKSYESILDNSFRLMVWNSIVPEQILFESYLYYPEYSGGRDLVIGYELEEPLFVEGTIFIGIKQSSKRVFVGFDRNNNAQQKTFYNVGAGWFNNSYEGSVMIRPEFGTETNPWPVSVDEVDDFVAPDQVMMYPNPAQQNVTIATSSEGLQQVTIYSLTGQIVDQLNLVNKKTISVAHLPKSLYMVEIKNVDSGKAQVLKLMVQ